MWYVYALRDPRDDKIRYIGQTSNLTNRISRHIRNGRLFVGPNPRLCDWIADLQMRGSEPAVDVLAECTTLAEAIEREAGEIAAHRKRRQPLLNGQHGEGISQPASNLGMNGAPTDDVHLLSSLLHRILFEMQLLDEEMGKRGANPRWRTILKRTRSLLLPLFAVYTDELKERRDAEARREQEQEKERRREAAALKAMKPVARRNAKRKARAEREAAPPAHARQPLPSRILRTYAEGGMFDQWSRFG